MLRLTDLIVIALYMLSMAGMGIYFAKKNNSTEEYFLGNRSFPGWAVGISMLGTSISSVSFLALPAAAYILDYRQLTPNLFLPVAAVMAIYIFIPFFRRGKAISAFEYLESRYGNGIRLYSASYFLIGQFLRLSTILYLVALPISAMLNIDIMYCILICGVLVGVYTVLGGIEAVIWTDVVQTIILLLGGLICVFIVIYKLPGGFMEIIHVGKEYNKFSLGPMEWGFGERTILVMSLVGLTSFIGEYSSNQNVIQRYIAAKSMREARKATLICASMSVPTWLFFFFVGSSMFVFYKIFPSEIVAKLAADEVLPHFILTQTYPGVGGLVIAACLAAGMSSLDSSINSISTVFTVDFIRRYTKIKDDNSELKIAKITSIVAGSFMILGALGICLLPRESIYDLSMILGSILCAATLAPFMLGFFTTRIGKEAICYGMLAAILFSIYNIFNFFQLLPDYLSLNIHIYMASLVCNLVMVLVAFGYSFIRPNKSDLIGLTVWTMKKN